MAGLALALAPAPVLASGFQLLEQSGSGLGNAYAGQAAGVKDASAILFNPAALTGIPGRQLVVSIEPIGPSTTFADSGSGSPTVPSTPPLVLPVPLGSGGGDAGDWIPVPNGYFSWQVGPQVWLGLGVNAPCRALAERSLRRFRRRGRPRAPRLPAGRRSGHHRPARRSVRARP